MSYPPITASNARALATGYADTLLALPPHARMDALQRLLENACRGRGAQVGAFEAARDELRRLARDNDDE